MTIMPPSRRNTMVNLCMAAAVLATPVPAQFAYESKSNIAARATYDHNAFQGATLVQMFEWPYESIAAECEMLGKAGYTHVQISPPMEHIKGSQWWTSYQPVSYKLSSKRGNAEQLSNMVKTCDLSNVKIIVDAVINHMTGGGSGTGIAGTKWSKYNYPEHPPSAFHYCAGNGKAKDIADYNNVKEVQECELVGLSDLDTSQSSVSKAIENYLNSLIDLVRHSSTDTAPSSSCYADDGLYCVKGIAGFRVDAAKHIDQQQLGNILKNVRGYPGIFVTQETIGGGGDPQALRPTTYAANGHVHEFGAAHNLKQHFDRSNGKEIQWLVKSKFGQSWGLVESRFANVFIANHDTERDSSGSTLTSTSANNAYVLASIFMLGWDYGVPTVLSGYDFDGNFDKGAPQDANTGLTSKVECFKNGFRCEHRWQAISNMVYLRKVAGKEAVSNTATGNAHQIAFGRGKLAFVAINNDSAAWTSAFKSGLPAGKYCNIIVGDIRDCTNPITVASDGSFQATVNPFDALAFVAA